MNKNLFFWILCSVLLIANTFAWTDTIATTTPIKAVHMNELRTEINSERANIGLTGYSWTDPTITTSTSIKATHFSQLRTSVNDIYSTLLLSDPSWTGSISANGLIRTYHMTEPRSFLDSVASTIDSYYCCGTYGGSDTGSEGSCPGTDDSACGTIDCDGLNYYFTSGGESATSTNYCMLRDYADLNSNRCEGINDCKDANTGDCTSYSDSTVATCGTCCFATGACTSCTNYNSATQGPTADYYYTSGTATVTGTNYCVLRDYHCTGSSCAETYGDSTAASCGLCKYAAGACSSCYNYPSGTDSGLCRECNGAGAEQADTDDAGCGTISCDDWHHIKGGASATGTNYCYDAPDITTNRCEGLGDCKDANTADCGVDDDTLEVSCGTCKFVAGCSGTTDGYCANYGAGTSCGTGYECDGNGNCIASAISQTLWMGLANGYLYKRDINENFFTSLGDKGYDIQQMAYANNKLWLAQYDGSNFILSSCTLDGTCTSHGVKYAARPDSMAYYKGYIYVGTWFGDIIRCTTSSTPTCTYVGTVYTDAYSMDVFGGYLWIGAYNGRLAAYDGTNINYPQTFPGSGTNRIFAMSEFDNKLWVTTELGYVYSCADPFRIGNNYDTTCTYHTTLSGTPYSMSVYNNKLWIGTTTGSLYSCTSGGSCTEQRTFDYYIPDLETFDDSLQVLQYVASSGDGAWECSDSEAPCNSKGTFFSQPVRLVTSPPEGDIIYVTENAHNGNFGGRSGVDDFCYDNIPAKLSCDNVRAFVTVSTTDEIRDMPGKYGYDSNDAIYWYNRDDNSYSLLANNWADMLDGSILSTQSIGANVNNKVWTGSTSSGADGGYGFYTDCLGWTSSANWEYGIIGTYDSTISTWLYHNMPRCDDSYRLRCVCKGASS